jgi:hypothetical protein
MYSRSTISLMSATHLSRKLIAVLGALYQSEINAGLQSVYDHGFNVWIGIDHLDALAIQNFHVEDLDKAAEWLHKAAIRHYPDSHYARLVSSPITEVVRDTGMRHRSSRSPRVPRTSSTHGRTTTAKGANTKAGHFELRCLFYNATLYALCLKRYSARRMSVIRYLCGGHYLATAQ